VRRFPPHCILLVAGLAIAGCGPSSETDRELLFPPPDTTAQLHRATFETQTDTVPAVGSKQEEPVSPYNSAPVRFMVQIGAFREATFASTVQTLARERYQLPVVNDYNATRKIFQVRIGFFETLEDATDFLVKLRADYPLDYGSAWIVRLK
jgi:cell division protein FtsN